MYIYEIHCHNLATRNDEVVESAEYVLPTWLDYWEHKADELQAADTSADHVYIVNYREVSDERA